MTDTTHSAPYRRIWCDLQGVNFSQGLLDRGGVRTRYLRSRRSSLPPRVLLRSVGGHAEPRARNLASHGAEFDVQAIDRIGHSWADELPRGTPLVCVSTVFRHLGHLEA